MIRRRLLGVLGALTVAASLGAQSRASDAGAKPEHNALRQLRRNVVTEIVAGAAILAVVAVLGVTPPGLGE